MMKFYSEDFEAWKENMVQVLPHCVTCPDCDGDGKATGEEEEREKGRERIRALRDQLTELQGKVGSLQRELNEKLDLLLSRKP